MNRDNRTYEIMLQIAKETDKVRALWRLWEEKNDWYRFEGNGYEVLTAEFPSVNIIKVTYKEYTLVYRRFCKNGIFEEKIQKKKY